MKNFEVKPMVIYFGENQDLRIVRRAFEDADGDTNYDFIVEMVEDDALGNACWYILQRFQSFEDESSVPGWAIDVTEKLFALQRLVELDTEG